MRWEQLFADLDARFDEISDAEMMAALPDLQREAASRLTVVQRCLGAIGSTLRVRVRSGGLYSGELRSVGPDWILLQHSGHGELLLPLAGVVTVEGLTAATGTTLTAVARRCTLRLALRGIARDRASVVLTVVGAADGHSTAGLQLSGTIDRVGEDFVEMAQHAMWEPRRAGAVRSMLLVPFAAVDSVRAIAQV